MNNDNNILATLQATNLCFDLSSLPIIRIQKGPKTEAFLQGQMTCNVKDVSTTHSKLSAICNSKARVISLFRILRDNEDYLLCLPNNFQESLWEHLKKYGVFSQIMFDRENKFTIHVGITGNTAFLQPDFVPKNIDDVWTNGDVTIIKLAGLVDRYEVLATSSEKLQECLSTDVLEQRELGEWYAQNIAVGLAQIESTTQGLHTPHHLNLKTFDAISFDKGCYIGQEIIAKMEHLGRIKKLAFPALIESTTIQIGDPICNEQGQNVGDIVNAASLGNNQQIILGIFPIDKENTVFSDQNKHVIRLLNR